MNSGQTQDTDDRDKRSRIRFTLDVVLSCGTVLAAGAALYCLIAEVLAYVRRLLSDLQVVTHLSCSDVLSSAGTKWPGCESGSLAAKCTD